MSCECNQIGGRFIAEDPNCPVHGASAQACAEQELTETEQLHARIEYLEHVLSQVDEYVTTLQDRITQLEQNKEVSNEQDR